jgi:hypothetical protein
MRRATGHNHVLIVVLALAAAVYAAHRLYVVHTAWSVTLAILVAGGALVAGAIVLRNAPRSATRRRGAVPADPGIPKPPLGAPYRGL